MKTCLPIGYGIRARRSDGFTFVEVIVSLALLGVALAGIYSVITMAMQTRKHAHDYYVGTIIAGNQIERAKTFLFDELFEIREDETRVDERGVASPTGKFLRTTTVENVPGNSELRQVNVLVEVPHHTRGTPGGGAITMSTFVADIQ